MSEIVLQNWERRELTPERQTYPHCKRTNEKNEQQIDSHRKG